MAGKPKNTKAPKAEKPLDDEFPEEEFDEQPVETAAADDSRKYDKSKTPEKKKKSRKFKLSSIDPIILASFSIFMIACLVVTGITVYGIVAGDASNNKVAEYGDTVEIRYTGSYFYYYDTEGTSASIFDSNVSSVIDAINNGTYKHSYDFKDNGTDLFSFTIGGGSTATGFDVKFIGHKPGESFRFYIDDGYGSLTEGINKFDHAKAGISLKKEQTFTNSDYMTFFGKDEVPAAPLYNIDTPYGWKADVSSLTGDMVKVIYQATEGETYGEDGGVKIKVTSTAGDSIVYDYQVDSFDYNTKILKTAYDNKIVYVIGADDTNMTYKTTDEKTGTRMFFVVEIISYAKSS